MRTIEWKNGKVKIIDQTQLPRGAPALGVAVVFGCVLGSDNLKKTAFEVTPARFIAGMVTEKGIAKP